MAVFKDLRKREFLNAEGADKPLKSPLSPETLRKARLYRKQRLVDRVVEHDCAAILLYDPVNIRYAVDVSNMQVWMLHNASHYALVCADGRAIDFEYGGSEHLASGLEMPPNHPGNSGGARQVCCRQPGRVGIRQLLD